VQTLEDRLNGKKASIDKEFLLQGLERTPLVPRADREFLVVNDIKQDFELIRPLGTGLSCQLGSD
jgi:hypothetical protein